MVHLLELMVELTHSLNMYLPQGSGTYIPEKILAHILFHLAMHLVLPDAEHKQAGQGALPNETGCV